MLTTFLLSLFSVSWGFLLVPDGQPHQTREKCYPDLGCFNNNPPFNTRDRTSYLPADLDAIGTHFLLYTRNNWNLSTEVVLTANGSVCTGLIYFNPVSDTKIIVPGFLHNTHEQWIHEMVGELLKYGNMNVIVALWSKGAQLPFGQAAANTRVVGAQIAQLVKSLVDMLDVNTDKVHIIGHSLGAHVAGYAGERISGLGRISGLDPSSPSFDGTPPQVRLDPSDATFVDVIHTDASSIHELGMGATDVMGHVDFYPNGGHDQPGCDQDLLSKITHTVWDAATIGSFAAEGGVACSHLRAIDLFTESINTPCPFQAYPCASADEFAKGNCLTCSGNGCSRLGYHADQMTGRGSLYLQTQNSSSYCSYHYRVSLTSANAIDGVISVDLCGDHGHSEPVPLSQKNEIVHAGSTVSRLLTTRQAVGTLSEMGLHYEKTDTLVVHLIYADIWKLRAAVLFSGETQSRYDFCAGGAAVPDQATTVFRLVGHC